MYVQLTLARLTFDLLRARLRESRRDERGSQVLEYVLMAGAGVLLVLLAYAALKAFVLDAGESTRRRAEEIR